MIDACRGLVNEAARPKNVASGTKAQRHQGTSAGLFSHPRGLRMQRIEQRSRPFRIVFPLHFPRRSCLCAASLGTVIYSYSLSDYQIIALKSHWRIFASLSFRSTIVITSLSTSERPCPTLSTCPLSSRPPRIGMRSLHVNPYLARRPAILGLAKVLLIAIAQLPIITAAPLHGILLKRDELGDPDDDDDPELWLYLLIAAALVLAGGAFAGLTIALMGQVR